MFDKTEEEQIQTIKEWFKKYYLWLIVLLLVITSSYFGQSYWQQSVYEAQVRASSIYSDIQRFAYAITVNTDADEQNIILEDMTASKNAVVSLYTDSIYADLSRQLYASTLASLGHLDEATQELELLVASKDLLIKNNSLIAFARVRWQQGNIEEALQLLGKVGEGFAAIAIELEGDIYLSENRAEEARYAYQRATMLQSQQNTNSMLRMKLNYVSQ